MNKSNIEEELNLIELKDKDGNLVEWEGPSNDVTEDDPIDLERTDEDE